MPRHGDSMRIVLLVDDYLPLGTRVHAKMMHELALGFQRRGHKVVVITPGSPNQASSLVIDYLDKIEVWRFKSGQTRNVGMIRRAITESLLSYRAWNAIRGKMSEVSFDLCVNYSPTIFFGPLAKRFRAQGSFVYLVLRDMFPQWIIDQGLIKDDSLPACYFRYYENLNYACSDKIGVMSQANLNLFKKKYPMLDSVEILRNWSSTSSLPPVEWNNNLKVKLGIAKKVVFFYGGNIGHAQDMTNIMRLARNLKSLKKAHFLIIGQGDEFNLIQDLRASWSLDNVTILPAVSQDEFSRILPIVDVGLFSLSKLHCSHNFPGKLLGYMAESKPILGSVNPGNDLQDLIESTCSGFVCVNGDDELFAEAAIRLVKNYTLRRDMGRNSKNLLLQKFSVDSAVMNIESAVKS